MNDQAAITASETITHLLDQLEIPYTINKGEGGEYQRFIVKLPGEKKFTTPAMITVQSERVNFEAFICRNPEENYAGVYQYLLKRNRGLYVIRYTLDEHGDIYLVGTLSLEAFTSTQLDTILGQLTATADQDFNILLELGFATSIRKEWAWRTRTGQSTKNLSAFAHLIDENPIPESSDESADTQTDQQASPPHSPHNFPTNEP